MNHVFVCIFRSIFIMPTDTALQVIQRGAVMSIAAVSGMIIIVDFSRL